MVTVEGTIAALSMPPDVRVEYRVPRTQLVAHGAPTRADERTLAQGVDEVSWVASLRRALAGRLKAAGLHGATIVVSAKTVRAEWPREVAKKRVEG